MKYDNIFQYRVISAEEVVKKREIWNEIPEVLLRSHNSEIHLFTECEGYPLITLNDVCI